MESFLRRLPKVELHLHLEGTLEPKLVFQLKERNHTKLRYETVEELEQAYGNYHDLQSFLDVLEDVMRVLVTSDDFYDAAWAYFQRAAEDNVRHCELFIDIQAHLNRGVTLQCQFDGLQRACQRAERELHLTTAILISFIRHESEQSALKAFEQALEYRDYFVGIALDSSESDNPPSKFVQLYQRAHELGLHCVAHAGEEGPAEYVRQAIELLHIERIDHGIHSKDDLELLDQIALAEIPLTICPLSNVSLKVVEKIEDLPIKLFLEKNVKITINSDDPPFFHGYILANFLAVQEAFQFSNETWIELTRNAINAAFINDTRREELFKELETIVNDPQ